MQAHGPGQGQAFGVAALADQVVHLIAVAHRHGGLGNDRPAIKLLAHVVGGGTDQFHAPLPGPVVGLGPLEGRQEGVVDVDHPVEGIGGIEGRQKGGGEHLHVLGEHHQFDAVLGQQLQVAGLGGLPVGGVNRHAGEVGAEFLGQRAQVGVVADHQRHPHRQLARAGAPEQVEQAVVLLAHEDRHRRPVIGEGHLELAIKPFGQGLGRGANRLPRQAEARQLPFDPAEEQAGALVAVVVGVDDVAAIGRHPAGQLPHQTRPVRADHLQDGGYTRVASARHQSGLCRDWWHCAHRRCPWPLPGGAVPAIGCSPSPGG